MAGEEIRSDLQHNGTEGKSEGPQKAPRCNGGSTKPLGMTEDTKEPPSALAEGESEVDPYSLEGIPPWYMTAFFAFQHYITMIGGTIATPLLMTGYLCMSDSDPARGDLISTIIFCSGIITFIQTTFGLRLPIIQGGNFAYLVPSFTLLTTAYIPCDKLPLANYTMEERQEEWQSRLRELQGAIAVSSIVQVIIGFTGLVGVLLNWITPLTIIPTVTMLGLSLFEVGANKASGHWGISITTLVLLALLAQYLRNVKIPVPICSLGGKSRIIRYPIFTCFPLLIVIVFMWSLCGILTATGALSEGSKARTDISGSLLQEAQWFRVPYPGQFGVPKVSVAGVVGMLAAVVASIIESIGDYHALARVCGVPAPPTHSINRAVGMEGIGGIITGLWGTTSGTASYTGNIAIIGITKVSSRRVMQYSAVFMLVTGVFGKLGALFATIPEPVMAGVIIFMFSIITGLGLSPLQFVSLSSSRNIFVLGFSIFIGLSLPNWMEKNPGVIDTGFELLDHTLTVLLQTSMLVGGAIGMILDNTVPGTAEERGLVSWRNNLMGDSDDNDADLSLQSYDLPCGMEFLSRQRWAEYVPFLPTFQGFRRRKSDKKTSQTSFSASHANYASTMTLASTTTTMSAIP